MIGRNKGFAKAIRKLEGREDAGISSSPEAGRWESTGYGLILKLLRGEWSWTDYVRGLHSITCSERQACLAARIHLGLESHTLGLHVHNEDSLVSAMEYFELNPIGEQQEGVQEDTSSGSTELDTSDVLRDPRDGGYVRETYTATIPTRPRQEPHRWYTTRVDGVSVYEDF